MRWLVALIAVLTLGPVRPMTAAERPVFVRSAWFSGKEYVNLSDWAEARAFQMYWPRHAQDITLSSGWARLALQSNSRLMVIRGVTAVMSLPVVCHGDAAYISRLDLNTLIHPILYPGRPDKPKKITKVALDAGHGGKDPGNEAAGVQEKKHTLLLAKEIQQKLTALGIKVVMTRATDTYVDNHDRPVTAKKNKADLFISLHYNSVPSGRSDANGAEVYCLTPASAASTNDHGESGPRGRWPGNALDDQNVLLAYLLQKNISASGILNDRGLKRARYTVLCNAEMPAVLIEAGFMSDPQEAHRIESQAYRRQVALSIVDGVLAYKRYIDRPPAAKPAAKPVTKAKSSKAPR